MSIFRYQFDALVQLQFHGRDDGCGIIDDPAYLATAKVKYPREAAMKEACDSILRDNDLQVSNFHRPSDVAFFLVGREMQWCSLWFFTCGCRLWVATLGKS